MKAVHDAGRKEVSVAERDVVRVGRVGRNDGQRIRRIDGEESGCVYRDYGIANEELVAVIELVIDADRVTVVRIENATIVGRVGSVVLWRRLIVVEFNVRSGIARCWKLRQYKLCKGILRQLCRDVIVGNRPNQRRAGRPVRKTVRIHGGLVVDGADARSRERRGVAGALQDALVEKRERVVEMACKLVGRGEGAAEAEGVLHTGRLDADVEEGLVAVRIDLRNPDRAADVEAVVVLVQRVARRAAVGEGVEEGIGVAVGDRAVEVAGSGRAALHDDAAAGAAVLGREPGGDDGGLLHFASGEIDAGAREAGLGDVGAVNDDGAGARRCAADRDACSGSDVAGVGAGVFGGDAAGLEGVAFDAGNEQRGLKRAALGIGKILNDRVIDSRYDIRFRLGEQVGVGAYGDALGNGAVGQHEVERRCAYTGYADRLSSSCVQSRPSGRRPCRARDSATGSETDRSGWCRSSAERQWSC